MSITTRQTNLLVNQDWTTLYQTFKQADFQSYDFETLRKAMIDYLQTYYPEDFNDFTESSEYIALIDLIAFLGQSLAFRTDLNARENFFDTAERRDSILKLARLISYNPSRHINASGQLKIDSVSTTESVFDSNGLNLSNLLINWNDTANPDWQEQLTTVLNAALINNQQIGIPGNTNTINGVETSEYSINLPMPLWKTVKHLLKLLVQPQWGKLASMSQRQFPTENSISYIVTTTWATAATTQDFSSISNRGNCPHKILI